MKVSIIIPTYNEENYLPPLLKSIKEQKFNDYEVIIADNNSLDRTVDIAKDYGCKVVSGGLPAVGRNNGAKVATGDILIFLDSDLMLTRNYLEEVVDEFEEEGLGISITQMTPLSKNKRDIILHDFANWFMIAVENIKPHGAGCYGIIAKKELFLNGLYRRFYHLNPHRYRCCFLEHFQPRPRPKIPKAPKKILALFLAPRYL